MRTGARLFGRGEAAVPRRLVLGLRIDLGLGFGMTSDAEQALLQVAVGGQARGIDDAIDAAVDHDGDAVGDRRRHPDILLDDEHRDVALLAQPHQHLLDLCDDDGGESFGRLVHDQEARIGHQRARDRQHLLLAAGELASAIVLALGEAREGVVDALDRPRATAHARGHAQMLVDGERAPQPSPLRHVADAEPGDLRRLQRQQVLAAHADRTTGRAHQPHDRLAERRLAHAVAADDGKHAGVERQVDALQRVRAAVIDVEASDLEDRCGAAGVSHAPPPR